MLQACMFPLHLPPGPCVKVVLRYHSPLKNGNLNLPLSNYSPMRTSSPRSLQSSNCPMEGCNYHTEKQ